MHGHGGSVEAGRNCMVRLQPAELEPSFFRPNADQLMNNKKPESHILYHSGYFPHPCCCTENRFLVK